MTEPTPAPLAPRADGAPARYAAAVAAPLVALGLTWIAPALQDRAVFLIFFGAVAVAAWFGAGPGLLATALSIVLVDVAFIPPVGSLKAPGIDDVARLMAFAGVAGLIAAISERSRLARAEVEAHLAAAEQARQEADARRQEAEALARQLQDQAVELEQQTDEAQALTGELEQSNGLLADAARHVDAERLRVTQVLDALDASVLMLDAELRVLHLNRTARELFEGAGREAGALLGRPLPEAMPELTDSPLLADVARAARTGEAVEADHYHPTLDRWRHVRALPADGGVVVVARDVTDARRARERVAESEARYRALVEASSTMVWRADAAGMIDDMPVWRELTGQTLEQVRGAGWADALHPDDRPRVEHLWREAHAAGRPYEAEYRIRLAEGGYRWYQARAVPMRDDEGRVVEWIGSFIDVHERHRAEGALALLADASRLLAATLDVESTLRAVARLVVPTHADYCVVHVFGDDGVVAHAVAHADPAGDAALRSLVARPAAEPDGPLGWTAVARTGRAQHFAHVQRAADLYARDPEHARLLDQVGTRSAIVLPLAARDRVLGALTLGSTDAQRRFDERDLSVGELLARRVAMALDSAQLFAAERRARAAAEAASRAKSEFLATMSHELRTPLNAILGYTSLMLEGISGPVTEEQRTQLGRVQGSSRHLLALIEEILSLSRLEAGSERVRPERVDLCALARDTAAMVEPSVSMRGLGFLVDVPAAPAWASTDATKVRQVLLNLLANAAKFTERGEVSLAVRPRADRTVFEVRDSGIGIAPEHLERIFDPFWQVEQSATRRVGGTGLGLHVARRLARLLGGDVTVQSAPGAGSIFRFWVSNGSAGG